MRRPPLSPDEKIEAWIMVNIVLLAIGTILLTDDINQLTQKETTQMKLTIKGNEFTITGKINEELEPSASGKTLSLFSSGGNVKTGVMHDGAEVTVGLNVYVKNPDYKKGE